MPKHRVRSDNEEWGDLGPSCVNRGFPPENLSSKYPPKIFQTRPKTQKNTVPKIRDGIDRAATLVAQKSSHLEKITVRNRGKLYLPMLVGGFL